MHGTKIGIHYTLYSAFVYMYSAILTCLSMQQLHLDRTHTAEQDLQAERQVEQTQSESRETI